jgi:hypothetical protein
MVVTGMFYIVPLSTGRCEIVRRTAKVALALFVIDKLLSYLWADRIGRLLLIATIVFMVAKLVRGRQE